MTAPELLRAIGDIGDIHIAGMYDYIEKRNKRKRPKTLVLVAAIALLAIGMTVGASGIVHWEDASWFDGFFSEQTTGVYSDAISEHQHALLDTGLVKIGQAVEQDGYTVTLDSALCDGHRLLAKLLVDAPEGTVLEEGRYDIDLEYKALLPDGSKLPFRAMTGSCGQLADPDPTDGRLYFLLDVLMQPTSEADMRMLMGAKWEIRISQILFAYSREEAYWEDPLATGEWSFTIVFDEASLLTREMEVLDRPVRMGAERMLGEHSFPMVIRVTSLKIRALSATLSYDRPLTGFWHGIDMPGDLYIILRDGTVILAHWSMGFDKGDHWQETFTFPVPVAWEDVTAVILPNGERIGIG